MIVAWMKVKRSLVYCTKCSMHITQNDVAFSKIADFGISGVCELRASLTTLYLF